MEATSVTSKGQVTIPKDVRQQLGIRQGSRIEFSVVGDHVEMRVKSSPTETRGSGFGMLKSCRSAVPADFDPQRIEVSLSRGADQLSNCGNRFKARLGRADPQAAKFAVENRRGRIDGWSFGGEVARAEPANQRPERLRSTEKIHEPGRKPPSWRAQKSHGQNL